MLADSIQEFTDGDQTLNLPAIEPHRTLLVGLVSLALRAAVARHPRLDLLLAALNRALLPAMTLGDLRAAVARHPRLDHLLAAPTRALQPAMILGGLS